MSESRIHRIDMLEAWRQSGTDEQYLPVVSKSYPAQKRRSCNVWVSCVAAHTLVVKRGEIGYQEQLHGQRVNQTNLVSSIQV